MAKPVGNKTLSLPVERCGEVWKALRTGSSQDEVPDCSHGEARRVPQQDETERFGLVAPTWAELVRDHSAQVYRLAYRLTGNRHDAEDLTQDVFVRVFKSIHNFQPGTLEGWLHRITTNLFLDSARRRQRIRMDALSSAPEHVWGPQP